MIGENPIYKQWSWSCSIGENNSGTMSCIVGNQDILDSVYNLLAP